MRSHYIFEILIYRLSPDDRVREKEKAWQKHHPSSFFLPDSWDEFPHEKKKEIIQSARRKFDAGFRARGWKYNDVIGYVSIFASRMQVKADYWYTEGRIRNDMKKRALQFGGKAFEILLNSQDTRESIRQKILGSLINLGREEPFRNSYIDIDAFERISPFVEWEKLAHLVDSELMT